MKSAAEVWTKLPVYRARILTADVADIVVKRARRLEVGQRISFATVSDLVDAERGHFEKWRTAVIWRIDKGLLRLTGT